jgi:ATP-dependent 26S proteasome regulatory subunit
MLAKAIAKEGGAVFIPVQSSKMQCMYMGESCKMVAACFSLATKLAPSVLFFDEMDLLLPKGGVVVVPQPAQEGGRMPSVEA